LNVVSRAVRQK